MKSSSPLLINEHPLQVLPTLAVLLGLNEAMILQQINFWLCNKDKRSKPYINEGEAWVYNTYEEWHEQFPFWSVPTIKRAVLKLEEMGILVTRQFDLAKGDARKYYRIDHQKLTSMLGVPSDQVDPTPQVKTIPPSDQIDPTMMGSKRSDLIRTENPENTSERECDSLTDLLCELYAVPEGAGWQMRDKLQSLAIQLDGLNAKPAEVRAFWEYRLKKPALNYFAGDFTTWRASQPSAKSASGKSSAQTIQAPADYARFYERAA